MNSQHPRPGPRQRPRSGPRPGGNRHHLLGGLAATAVAATLTLGAPTAQAAQLCGQPAVPAATSVVHHPAVIVPVPAVTHLEWRWERFVDVLEQEYSVVDAPARTEVDWTRQVPGPVEHEYVRKVIDQAFQPATPDIPATGHYETVTDVPAVTEVQVLWRHRVTDDETWKPEEWGAQNGQGNGGWERVPGVDPRVVEITPAQTHEEWVEDTPFVAGTPEVPEQSHLEHAWTVAVPGGEWQPTGGTRPGPPVTEDTTTAGDTPAGSGWSPVATRLIDAVTSLHWAVDVPAAATPTGATRVAGSDHEVTGSTSATAPAGNGWSRLADSETTVEDQPAAQQVLEPAYDETVVVTPAVPAGAPCPEVGGPQAGDSGAQAAPAQSDTVAPMSASAAVLPNTGSPVSPLMAAAGLGAVLAGSILVGRGWRRTRA